MVKLIVFRVLVLLTFLWCVVVPLVWANDMSEELNVTYFHMIQMYVPEAIFAGFCFFILPCLWLRKRWALYALWIGAISMPFLQLSISKLTDGVWLMTLFLLSFLTWLFYLLNRMQL